MLSGKRFAVEPKNKKLPNLILTLSKKSITHWGVSNISDITAQVGQETNQKIDSGFIACVVSSKKDFHWLDDSREWFLFSSSNRRNRLKNIIKKILSIAPSIDISELRAGTARYHRMEGFALPRRVLLQFCGKLPWCKVEGNNVIVDPPLNWEEVLDRSSTEWAIAAILKEDGPVMSRLDLQKKCHQVGMSQAAFYQAISYSPIITKYASGVYGLRGAKLQPGIVESLKSKQKPTKVLVDFGWTHDERIWLGHQVSSGMIQSGVFTVPASMQEFLQGKFTLETPDEAQIGNLRIKDSSGWNLGHFFRRRGGEPGDHLVLTFDLTSRKAKVYVGDEDLFDEFRPEH